MAENTEGRPCMVCGNLTDTDLSIPDNEVLCIVHWFTEDVSEEWEGDDGE